MTEAELATIASQVAAMTPAVPDVTATKILATQGLLKIADVLAGGIIYLVLLWILSGNHIVGRWLFRYADEVALDEENARDPDPNVHLHARSNLALVNAARIVGFAIVTGCILAF